MDGTKEIFIQQYMHWHNVTFSFVFFKSNQDFSWGREDKLRLKNEDDNNNKKNYLSINSTPQTHVLMFVGNHQCHNSDR